MINTFNAALKIAKDGQAIAARAIANQINSKIKNPNAAKATIVALTAATVALDIFVTKKLTKNKTILNLVALNSSMTYTSMMLTAADQIDRNTAAGELVDPTTK